MSDAQAATKKKKNFRIGCLMIFVCAGLMTIISLNLPPSAGLNRLPQHTLVNAEGGNTLVWKDRAAFDRAMKLLIDGAAKGSAALHSDLLVPLLACRAPKATPIIITDSGMFSSEVLVVSGALKGCRGIVTSETITTAWVDPKGK